MKHLCLTVLSLWLSIQAFAGIENTSISFNGNKADRYVTEVSYDENQVVLHWNDNTTMCDDVSNAMINLACNQDLDKARLTSISGLYKDNITLEGIAPGSTVFVYDIQGRQLLHLDVTQTKVDLDIKSLNTGIYLLKSQNDIIKFTKQ
ncbi:MAG: T9SS type A sorting domain-containing protein [Prevotella sp.]|nr:T9SS type A sorting domain-containing protein [Prevotella sp.]